MGTGSAFGNSERGEVIVRHAFRFLLLTVIAMLIAALLIVMQVDRRNPIQGPLLTEALNSPVRAGDSLLVRITRNKVRDDCPVISVRSLITPDGQKIEIPGGVSKGGPDDQEHVDLAYPIPADTPPGDYELRVHLTYVCNAVPPFEHDQEPVRFRVIGG